MSDKDDSSSSDWVSHIPHLNRMRSDRVTHNKPTKIKMQHNSDDKAPSAPFPITNPIDAEAIISYFTPNLPLKRLRQFKQGKMPPEHTLDLHQQTRETCMEQVNDAIQTCQHNHYQTLLIIHGKNITGDVAVIKSYLNVTLRDHPNILAFTSAKPRWGGTGAILCLIKQTRGIST